MFFTVAFKFTSHVCLTIFIYTRELVKKILVFVCHTKENQLKITLFKIPDRSIYKYNSSTIFLYPFNKWRVLQFKIKLKNIKLTGLQYDISHMRY